MQGQSTKTYRVILDACHSQIENEGTGNRITVDFYAGSRKITSQSKSGISPCIGDGAEYSIRTAENITRAVVSTNRDDGFYIDEAYLYINNTLAKKYGSDDGKGWCLSTDPNDAFTAWKGYIDDNKCHRQLEFRFVNKLSLIHISEPTRPY